MARHAPHARRGFTLVELLVVIAIISTLMGLLLPAVQNAREAGRRNTCMNNIGQLSKATIAYDGTKSVLPGWRNAFPNPLVATQAVYWPISLLPHLERGDLYRIMETGSASGTRQFLTAAGGTMSLPTISIFQCPSAPPSSDLGSTTAYAANAGSGLAMPAVTNQAKGDGVFLDRFHTAIGAARYYSAARNSLDSVSSGDGTANTLLFGEKTSNLLNTQATWAAVAPVATGTSAILNWANAEELPLFGIPADSTTPKPLNTTTVAALGLLGLPSSTHPGGIVAAFADGHVQYVKDSIDCWVYTQLVSSDTKYNGSYYTNSARVGAWLGLFELPPSSGVPPYLINEADFK